MAIEVDPVSFFYSRYLEGEVHDRMETPCPFCAERGYAPGRLIVYLNKDSYFNGYFRCSNRCVPGGFPLWFAHLKGTPFEEVPGYEPSLNPLAHQVEYPLENINDETNSWHNMFSDAIIAYFNRHGVGKAALKEMNIGYNGRYIAYPYYQDDGNCYSTHCIHPDQADDSFWHGNETFFREPFNVYNLPDIAHCENGALFVCEAERNLLCIKQLGFPGVAVPYYQVLEKIDAALFEKIDTVFISVANTLESENSAKNLASRIGYKARILQWPNDTPRKYDLWQLARDTGKDFGRKILEMVRLSRSFSPFATPRLEYNRFLTRLEQEKGDEYKHLFSGFSLLDRALGGVHGINVIGGAPKVGKSTFLIQIASDMALRKIPVLYYDFENGRQRIYQRTICRLARMAVDEFRTAELVGDKKEQFDGACEQLQKMMFHWRVINDRKINPEMMRKHIDFIRHETKSEYTVVVVDSLHKLPFKDFSERRTGIDAWLRQMESIRDELQVSFLVISELSREGSGAYREEPHMGVFKGSGDIEYSADNAMVLYPEIEGGKPVGEGGRNNTLWLVASRENSPGRVANYQLDYPYWGFRERSVGELG